MNRKALLLTGIIATLLLVAPVYASYSTSFVYTQFNTATASYKALDTTYETWSFKVTNVLTYNTTIAGTATIRLNSTTAQNSYIDVSLCAIAGAVDIWWNDNGADAVKIGSGTWVKSEPIYLSRDSNGYLDFGNSTDRDCFIDNFVIGALTLENIGAFGEIDSCLSGYVSVEVASAFIDVSGMSESIMKWMPFVVQFVMLSVALGLITKFGKKVK